jgi:hypothetical protein
MNINQDIFKKNNNWDIELIGSWEYFLQQKERFPNYIDLYKSQIRGVLKDIPKEIYKMFDIN